MIDTLATATSRTATTATTTTTTTPANGSRPVSSRRAVQRSIEDFLLTAHGDKEPWVLCNTLSAEFGLRTTEEMESFISSALPEFKLVRLARIWLVSIFRKYVRPCRAIKGRTKRKGNKMLSKRTSPERTSNLDGIPKRRSCWLVRDGQYNHERRSVDRYMGDKR